MMASSYPVAEPGPLSDRDPLPPEDRTPPARRFALEALYRDHAPRLLKFFVRRAGPDDAGDLLHETFARFARLDEQARTIVTPEAYLGTVATNLLRDRARIAARRAREFHQSFEENSYPSADPHQLLEDRDALARVEEAVLRLSSRRRRIFLLHRLEHLTYAEIADATGMSVKGVKKQMVKALFELRRDLDRS